MSEIDNTARYAEIARTVLAETSTINDPAKVLFVAEKVGRRFARRRNRDEAKARQTK